MAQRTGDAGTAIATGASMRPGPISWGMVAMEFGEDGLLSFVFVPFPTPVTSSSFSPSFLSPLLIDD